MLSCKLCNQDLLSEVIKEMCGDIQSDKLCELRIMPFIQKCIYVEGRHFEHLY